ncbi:MAG: response regulator [Deltaproteobacteria bacterium]|nr:MAG: response regulator [Deltaproteobacteria bacterium]
MTLRTKTSLLLAAIISLTLGVTGFFYLQFLQQSLKNSILSGVDAVAQSTSDSIARFIEDSLNDAQVAALALPVPALEKNDIPTLENRLRTLVETFPKFENGMFLLDKKGRVWVDYPSFPEVRGADVSFREYFQRTIKEKKGIIGVPYISKRTGQPVLTFTALLRGSANQVLGVLGCSVQILSPNALEGIRKIRIGKSGYVFVYDHSRLMILHPEDARVLKRDVPLGANRLFDAALEGFEGVGETVNSRGVPMLSAFKRIPGTDWIIGSQQLQSEAYAPISEARRNLFAGILAAVIASVGVGIIAVRRITRPLVWLRQRVFSLETAPHETSGKIQHELGDFRSSDEIGELAKAFHDISQKLQNTLISLRRASNDWERTFNTVPDLIAIIDDQNKIVKINQAMAERLGLKVQETPGLNYHHLFPDLAPPPLSSYQQPGLENNLVLIQEFLQKELGQDFLVAASPLKSQEGEFLGSVFVARDISERRRAEEERLRLEAQMQEVQKLESLGVLAGGIAHDFNNLLMAILGNADLALLTLSPESPARPNVEEITRASLRAADLCRQMLAYSGKGRFTVGRYDLSQLVREMAQMLAVSVSKKAALRYSFAPELPPVEVDATQMRQIIMNLITNASEAMGDRRGDISVATGVMECDRNYLAESYVDDKLPEGKYVYLEVADTGAGMDEETRRRIFDPFFTTKFTGRGLGLAAVLGIVRGHQGAIKVSSTPGQGSIFRILLPAAARMPAERTPDSVPSSSIPCNGTILLVDDDPSVRQVGAKMLERLGLKVLTAAHGLEGVEIFRKRKDEIDCVLLDLTMPEMAGDEVFQELWRLKNDVCVILSSGYNEEDVAPRFAAQRLAGFVQKPYTMANLQATLNRVFGSK